MSSHDTEYCNILHFTANHFHLCKLNQKDNGHSLESKIKIKKEHTNKAMTVQVKHPCSKLYDSLKH